MKYYSRLLILFLLVTTFANAQQGPITIDNTTHTPQQLIQDVFITGGCANTSNINSSITESPTGIAYFERGNTIDGVPDNFPFANGIILSTGNAMQASGPSTPIADSDNGGGADTDLENASNITGTGNRSYIEFDFIPPTNEINFNYLFVSEEYNQFYECTYSDSFAFILTDLTTNITTNLAVLPNTETSSSFITCTNVRPAVTGECNTPANEQYFDKYNFDLSDPTVENNSPIVYGGQTIGLTASGTVIPGNQYHIKLVIADQGDTSLDSAVFIEGGSFGLGITLDIAELQIVNDSANTCIGSDINIDGIASGSTDLPIEYQWSNASGPIVNETTTSITVTTTGLYTLTAAFTFPDGSKCSDTQSVNVNFFDIPIANQPENLILCPSSGTDFEPFMLTLNDSNILGTQTPADYNISYHATQENADDDVSSLTSPYTNITNPQTIFVRIENNGNNECYDTNSFTLTTGDGTTATQPGDSVIHKCDDLTNGTENFNLTQFDSEILGTQSNTDYVISHHLLEFDANNNTNPIINTNPYLSTVPEQIIWVRVEDINNSDCYAITSFTLFVDHIPVAIQPAEMRQCDVTPFGEEIFDLTTQNEAILGGPVTSGGLDPALYTVNYHYVDNTSTQVAITSPTTYVMNTPVSSQEIFATVSNNANTSCNDVTSFFIFRDDIYTTAVPSTDLNITLCDDNNSGDLVEIFNLNAQIPTILGSGVTNATISFYTLEVDAISNTTANALTTIEANAFTSTTTNVAPFTQTIYYTISNNDNVDCFSTESFELKVDGLPNIVDPTEAFQACDLDIIDGVTDFDFTSSSAIEIINSITQGNTTYAVSFFANSTDAQNNISALPTVYTNQANQTVHVRIEDTITNCVTYTTLNLEVVTAPQAFPFTNPITYCDTDNDTFGYFDLNTIVSDLTGGVNGVDVLFYETDANAILNVGEIDTSVQYENIDADGDGDGSTQTIYAQLSVNGLECTTLVEVNLLVINSPELPSNELIYAQCETVDDPNTTPFNEGLDGIMSFDLTSYEITHLYTEIINTAGGDVTVMNQYNATYYTELDALGNPDPAFLIGNPSAFENETTPNQTIYVVVTHIGDATIPGTGCSTQKAITLHVDSLPNANHYLDYTLCDDDDYLAMDGVQTFDLPSQLPNMIASTNGLVITYYTAMDFVTGILSNPIPDTDLETYKNIANPQDVFVEFENEEGCSVVKILKLKVNPNPTPLSTDDIADNLGVMTSCDGDVDGSGAISEQVAEFDLTQWEIAILNGESGVSASYYTSEDNAAAGINAIDNPETYANIANPQTIYVSVINDGFGINPITEGTGCYTIVEFELNIPIPELSISADKEVLCVDASGVPLTNTSLPILSVTATPTLPYDYQWMLNGVAIAGATNETYSATIPGDYTVVVSGPTDLDCINVSQAITIKESGIPQGFNANVATNAFADSHQIVATAISDIQGIVFWYTLDNGEPTTNGTFDNVAPGIHTVTISDGENCWTITETVTIIDYPHFFTPNGDGINDTWTIIGQGEIPISQIYIFDRFGKLLSQLDPDGEGWDGTYNGSQMHASDYWFKIIYMEGNDGSQKEFKAHFSLKR